MLPERWSWVRKRHGEVVSLLVDPVTTCDKSLKRRIEQDLNRFTGNEAAGPGKDNRVYLLKNNLRSGSIRCVVLWHDLSFQLTDKQA